MRTSPIRVSHGESRLLFVLIPWWKNDRPIRRKPNPWVGTPSRQTFSVKGTEGMERKIRVSPSQTRNVGSYCWVARRD
ncbi:hypothetical protein GWI33_006398 [Rhynchophorus ferrugineus]|uniref:Uncharacterized protein n=1 Tax=Rhynchophorus ferrugineus TaxID=354439 RepID=A0A834IKI2_RHYFE|nr:hypothetical protein GWI33_006398 [Rhynchophorus ferrugineus]